VDVFYNKGQSMSNPCFLVFLGQMQNVS